MKLKYARKTLTFLALIFLFTGFTSYKKVEKVKETVKEEDKYKIIPKPLILKEKNGYFELDNRTMIYIENRSMEFMNLENRFVDELKMETGISLLTSDTKPLGNSIFIKQVNDLEAEEYELNVTNNKILIKASTAAGGYYALQSLKQLLPLENYSTKIPIHKIPAVYIKDKPVFEWRGYMLDVSRHFYGKEKVKEVLDFMASLKLNRFHMHLADDQGWRLEIKKYPKLTSVGAWRVNYTNHDETVNNWWGLPVQMDGEKATYGGFYTQEDMKEIIAYAKARYIEVIPEIDVPGHSQEILASYPHVSCDDGNYKVATGGVYKDNALCASKEETYTFLEEVLGEVMDLFPFNYIHIGGDECNKEGWKNHQQCQDLIKEKGLKDEDGLQSYFIKRVEKIVNAKGKDLIGWDEILEGGLAPNATVMSWRGEQGGIAAAKAKHRVIMTPNFANYLDLKQGQPDFEPNLGYSEALLSTCYNYSVIPDGLTQEESQYILGTQGNLWTESISDWGKLTYMTFPRLFAVAENGWTPEKMQDFDDFINRLTPRLEYLKANNIRYANSVYNPWIHQKGIGNSIEVSLSSELSNPDIRYTIDGTSPTVSSEKYVTPFTISETTTIKSAIFKNGKRLGNIIEKTYPIHKAAGAKVIYHNSYDKKYKAAGETALTDLNYGQLLAQEDENWQGFNEDVDIELVLDGPTDIKCVSIISLKKTIGAIYPPRQIEIYGSSDGIDYQKIGDSGFIKTSLIQGRNRIKTDISCKARNIKNLRIKAYLINPIPDGHHKEGQKSYLLIDEVIVL